ncbi:MAG: hypothetical protein HQL84_09690 [Magnetococcales bacterium]|nr:hypothetical protein [Magnetococcales bacterium]MBF0150302.1 hypothetical protein [Magnetococcales bacterium]
MTTAASRKDWLSNLRDPLHEFMETLKVPGHPGRFKPCPKGAVGAGTQASLGFSCFAHKIYYSLGLWERLSPREQTDWIEWIRSFQNPDGSPSNGRSDAFIDPHLLAHVPNPPYLGIRLTLRRFLAGIQAPEPKRDAIRAETKQAIATLAQIGVNPHRPFSHFPLQEKKLQRQLQGFDWSEPWSAGARTALLAVFVQTQADLIDTHLREPLARVITRFLDHMVNPHNGTYYRGTTPPTRGQMINGAMKVLNAMDWLEQPIHHPERLIDTTLEQGPPPAGCHVVDWIYVLHRCGLQTQHRRKEIQDRCLELIDLIKTHQNQDHGFSYQPHIAQTIYYHATISRGLDEGDIHGTCLLVWALTMIAGILEWDIPGWKIIRP